MNYIKRPVHIMLACAYSHLISNDDRMNNLCNGENICSKKLSARIKKTTLKALEKVHSLSYIIPYKVFQRVYLSHVNEQGSNFFA